MKQYTTGSKYKLIGTVLKIKKEIPTVIEIEGRRYVYEPNTVGRVKR